MVKATMDIRVKAVLFYTEDTKSTDEICSSYGISDRTLRRWTRSYKDGGLASLKPEKTGPKIPSHAIPDVLEQRILKLKQRHPSWGARRIKHQFTLPCHWKTVHNVIKRYGLLIRVKPKPQPYTRFQRGHVDSLWQGDTFHFRIRNVERVYVTSFVDDCSRYRVESKAYLHKGKKEAIHTLHQALRKGRTPKQIYLDNGKQFVANDFKKAAKKYKIHLIYGKPYHPRGRGKIEGYHKVLYRELISAKTFSSLSHFRKELWKFDKQYNEWRKQQVHDWQTPAAIYNNKKYFNKVQKNKTESGQKIMQQ